MRRSVLFSFAAAMLVAAVANSKGATVEDPYLWLEDVHGAKPLAWVHEQNQK